MKFMEKSSGGFLNPQKVLGQLEIKASSVIAHFGCGHGYFTIPLAHMVGPEGQIFAIDILEEAIKEVKDKAEKEGVKNIQTLRGNLELPGGSKMPDQRCDMVLLANILFQSSKKSEIIREGRRILKSDGKMVIIDWESGGTNLTAHSGWRISSAEAQRLAEVENFAFERNFDAGDYHYGLIFKKF